MCRSFRPVIGLFFLACQDSAENLTLNEYLGTAEVSDDMDNDGVLAADDCDDNDEESTIISEDEDCDGALDEYDCEPSNPEIGLGSPSSYLKLDEWDRNLDGHIARTRSYDYDEQGTLQNIYVEWGSGGFDEQYQNEYNENGQLTSHALSLEGEIAWEWKYDYDEAGARISSEKFQTASTGTIFLKEGHYYTYDEAGQIVMYEEANDSIVIDYREEYSYSVNGLLLTTEVDTNADGAVDEIAHFTYSGEGLQQKEIDRGLDDTVDVTYSYEYDSNGNIERVAILALERLEDEILGILESTEEPIALFTQYDYDSQGRLISFEKISEDGSVLFGKYYSYQQNGLKVWVITEENGEITDRIGLTYYADCEVTWGEQAQEQPD